MEAFRPLVFIYIFERFVYRIFDFLFRWYIGSFRFFVHTALRWFTSLDRFFALHITLRYFFKPLFGDHSLIGFFFGVIFRTVRVFLASILYCLLFLFLVFGYIVWALIPVVILARIFNW